MNVETRAYDLAWMQRMLQKMAARPAAVFIALSLGKIILFVALTQAGLAQPFVGDNAKGYYIPIAQRLITEGRFNGPDSRDDSWVSIGYPAFLAAIKLAAPHAFLLATVVVQMILDLGVAWLLYGIGAATTGRVAGWLAGVFWLVFPPAVLASTWITAECLYTVILLAAIAVLIRAMTKPGGRGIAWVAGVVLGLATLVRGTTILFPPFLFALLLLRPTSERLQKGLLFILGAAMTIAPWTLRNKIVLDDPILISVGIGQNFLQGCDARAFTIDGKRAQEPLMGAQARADGLVRPPGDKASIGDQWSTRVALHQYALRLRDRPFSYLTFIPHKFVRLFYGTESGSLKPQIGLAIFSALLIPISLSRIWKWRHELPLMFTIVTGVVVYFILLHWIMLPQYRYMHPVMPLLILALAQQVVHWVTARAHRGTDEVPCGTP